MLLLYRVFTLSDLLRRSAMVVVLVVVLFVCIVVNECTVMNISYTVVCSDKKYVDSNF